MQTGEQNRKWKDLFTIFTRVQSWCERAAVNRARHQRGTVLFSRAVDEDEVLSKGFLKFISSAIKSTEENSKN